MYVNEIAVFGTALFMMAVATVWYSNYLFQKQWLRAVQLTIADIEEDTQVWKRSLLTFGAYLIVVYCIGVAIGYAQVFGVSVQQLVGVLVLGFLGFIAGFVIWEHRSLTYYLITAGFSTVFITGSTFLLYYWPW